MWLEFHDRLDNPARVHVTRVVVQDDYGNALALAVEMPDGRVKTAHVLDKDFDRLLDQLGLARTTLVVRTTASRLD